MLYKYLFYSVSYVIKKYDNIWNVGEAYYVTGSAIVGIIIAATILGVMDLLGIIFCNKVIWSQWGVLAYLPLVFAILSIFYFGFHKRHERIYEEMATMDLKRKRTYKILNIIHIVVVNGIYLNTLALLTFLNN